MLYLAVGEEYLCAELQRSGDFCELDVRQNTTDTSDRQQTTYLEFCPCATGLVCSSAVSSSEESSVSPIFQISGACKPAEPESDEGELAD